MKKKLWIGIGVIVLTLGIGTAVYAADAGNAGFQQMLPFMKKMHPNLSEQQLNDMHKSCEEHNGSMGTMMKSGGSGMMKNMGSMMSGSSMM
ncbi:hypothetical protein SAMN04487895_11830 [Paenibacillus sophorae]|uniref:FAD/FMN-containing dehydrogenase n=1 Tax=Paenibacillus sophorae TaxID=1333845 RepID=A0A1H8UKY8_9BACL|nr:hypothetical protein [Paenibacillus sophorae]QWU13289.1 FAD/FMN-containing dehydrogenase [Paenibacillus sophorae]SEP03879.1 hypothetical protein SAMN04487895_11830 [Paenibacillus sophorae]